MNKKDIAAPLLAALKKRLKIAPLLEYRFHPVRRWRFDLAYADIKLGIEIDGATHASIPRHRADCEKRNVAIRMGWRVLTYPASCLLTKCRFPLIVDQIVETVCGITDPPEQTHVLVG